MANMTVEQMVQELNEWTVMELVNLKKALEDAWGVSAAAMVAPVATADGAPPAAQEPEQTEFTVELSDSGTKKINVIKVVREVTQLGLADAKNLVESAPKVLKEGVSKAEAEDLKKKLEEAGAKVTIK